MQTSGHLNFLIGIALVYLAPCRSTRVYPIVEQETILWEEHSTGDVDDYRIPVIGHAPDGGIVALSEARKYSSSDTKSKFLALRRSFDSGYQWTPSEFILSDDPDVGDGTNLGELVTDEETKTMMVVYSHCSHDCNGSLTYVISSHDNGVTWKNAVNLTEILRNTTVVFDPGPGQGLQKKHEPHKGRLLFCGHGGLLYDGLVCIYSDDHGHTWKLGADLPAIPYGKEKVVGDFEPNENQVVELPDGTLLFTIRNERHYHSPSRLFARSHDGGESIHLSDVYVEEQLPDPACAAGMVYLEDYNLLLHSNPFNDKERMNMTLSWSYDDGVTWNATDHLNVWAGPSGYSCLTAIRNKPGYVGLLYEKGRKVSRECISFVLINLRPS